MASAHAIELPTAGPARALSRLVQVLWYGEQTAAQAFEIAALRRSRSGDTEEMLGRLRDIASEEYAHERMLADLLARLPPEQTTSDYRSRVSHYFRGLACRDVGTHFARIAALDSAVCLLLSGLRKSQPQLYCATFARIARDEAQHVVIASHYAHRLCTTATRTAAAEVTRLGLIDLLAAQTHNFESLGIDSARLLRRLAIPPRCLRT